MPRSRFEISQVIQALRGIHIVNHRDRRFEDHLGRLFLWNPDGSMSASPMLFTGGTETNGILLVEGAGSGKTRTIEEVLRRIPALAHNPETHRPRYLHTLVTSPSSLKSLGSGILYGLGIDRLSERTKIWEIWAMVKHRMHLMGIVLLWIDEAHDLFRSESAADTDHMFRMIKSLMQGDHPVVVVLSGTERLGRLTVLDPQVARRFTTIEPYSLRRGHDVADLQGLIGIYCAKAGMVPAISTDTCNRLIYGARRRFGRVIDLTISAIECALYRGDQELRAEHFEEAWVRKEGGLPERNVFLAADYAAIDLSAAEDEYEAARIARANRNRNRRD